MALNVADLITEFGAYYEERGNQNDLMTRLTRKSVTDATFSDYQTTVRTVVRKTNAQITRVLQQFQKGWTPIGNTKFTPEKVELQPVKINVEETPVELEESWLGFLVNNSLDPRTYPFTRWWLEQLVLPKANEDYELTEIYKGVAAVVTPGTATGVGGSMDGFKVVLNRNIARVNEPTVPFSLGAVPTDDAKALVEYVEEFCAKIPTDYQGRVEELKMDETLGRLFIDGNDAKYNTTYSRISDVYQVKNRPIRIVSHMGGQNGQDRIPGLPSMNGSTKIITTLRGNSVLAKKNPENAKVFELEKQYVTLRAFTHWYVGVGWWIPAYVFTNDVELV